MDNGHIDKAKTDHPLLGLRTLTTQQSYGRETIYDRQHTQTEDETAWNDFRKIRKEIKKSIRAAKSSFYKRALSSKRSKKVWNTIHCILHPNSQTIKANPETLNKHFNTTAQRLSNSTPKTEVC